MQVKNCVKRISQSRAFTAFFFNDTTSASPTEKDTFLIVKLGEREQLLNTEECVKSQSKSTYAIYRRAKYTRGRKRGYLPPTLRVFIHQPWTAVASVNLQITPLLPVYSFAKWSDNTHVRNKLRIDFTRAKRVAGMKETKEKPPPVDDRTLPMSTMVSSPILEGMLWALTHLLARQSIQYLYLFLPRGCNAGVAFNSTPAIKRR